MSCDVFGENVKIHNYEGADLTESIRCLLLRNDPEIAKTNGHYITCSGDSPVFVHRWLYTAVEAGPGHGFCTEPFLQPVEDFCILQGKPEGPVGEIPDNGWFFVNEARCGPYHKNKPELVFPYDKKRFIYGIAYVYCSEETDLFININNSHNPLPMRLWINGTLVFCSPEQCLARRGESVFRFGRGGNVLLTERKIDPANKIRDRYLDTNFTLGLRPVKQLLAKHKSDPYFDREYVTRMKYGNTIVPEKAFYEAGENIEFFILPGFYNTECGKRKVQVTIYDTESRVIFDQRVNYFEKITIPARQEQEGVLTIKAGRRREDDKASACYIFAGNYAHYVKALQNRIRQREDCGRELLEGAARLMDMPDLRKNTVRHSVYPMDQCVYGSLLKGCLDLQNFLRTPVKSRDVDYSDVFPGGGQIFVKTRSNGGDIRSYSIFLPDGYDRRKKYPLVIQYVAAYGIYPIPGLNGQYMREILGRRDFGETMVAIIPCFYDRFSLFEILGLMDIIRHISDHFAVDMDRISLLGFCGSTSLCVQAARYLPHVFSAMALLAPYVEERFLDRGLEENLSNLQVIQIGNAEKGLHLAGFRYMRHFRKVDFYTAGGFEHEEFFNCYCSNKLMARLAECKRERFPGKVAYSSDSPALGRSFWLCCRSTLKRESGLVLSGEILNGDEIRIHTENARELDIYYDRQEMGLNNRIRLNLNNSVRVLELGDFGVISATIGESSAEYVVSRMDREEFYTLYNKIECIPEELGILEVYTGSYMIVAGKGDSTAERELTDNLLILLDHAAKTSWGRKNEKRIVPWDQITNETAYANHLICILNPGHPHVRLGEWEPECGISVGDGVLRYRDITVNGSCFLIAKTAHPRNTELRMLCAAYTDEAALAELIELLKRLDDDQILYNDAIIFHPEGYMVLRDASGGACIAEYAGRSRNA